MEENQMKKYWGGKKKDTTYKLLESGQTVRDIIICSLDAILFLQHLILATLRCTVLCYMSLQTDSSSAITFMILLQCYIYMYYIYFFSFLILVCIIVVWTLELQY